MRSLLVAWTLVLSLGAAATSAAKPPPKHVVIQSCGKSKAPVTLPHELHAKKEKIPCKACHHTGDTSKSCSAAKCHAGKAEGKRPGCAEASLSKNPFHMSCIGCHNKKSEGPKNCAQCHKK